MLKLDLNQQLKCLSESKAAETTAVVMRIPSTRELLMKMWCLWVITIRRVLCWREENEEKMIRETAVAAD